MRRAVRERPRLVAAQLLLAALVVAAAAAAGAAIGDTGTEPSDDMQARVEANEGAVSQRTRSPDAARREAARLRHRLDASRRRADRLVERITRLRRELRQTRRALSRPRRATP